MNTHQTSSRTESVTVSKRTVYGQLGSAKMEDVGQSFPELPRWEFVVSSEINPGEYRVTATRDGGIMAESRTGNPDEAVEALRTWAAEVEGDAAARKEYTAIVWIADQPGKRVTVRAIDADRAWARLRAEYGDEAVISTWNEEDASRPR